MIRLCMFFGDYHVQRNGKFKTIRDFVYDGLNGSVETIDAWWLHGSKDENQIHCQKKKHCLSKTRQRR